MSFIRGLKSKPKPRIGPPVFRDRAQPNSCLVNKPEINSLKSEIGVPNGKQEAILQSAENVTLPTSDSLSNSCQKGNSHTFPTNNYDACPIPMAVTSYRKSSVQFDGNSQKSVGIQCGDFTGSPVIVCDESCDSANVIDLTEGDITNCKVDEDCSNTSVNVSHSCTSPNLIIIQEIINSNTVHAAENDEKEVVFSDKGCEMEFLNSNTNLIIMQDYVGDHQDIDPKYVNSAKGFLLESPKPEKNEVHFNLLDERGDNFDEIVTRENAKLETELNDTKKTTSDMQDSQKNNTKTGRSLTFKPKPSTLDKLTRGPKFTTSTYGKMSQEGKLQLMKKFGTTTPEHSSLTMLDLIYFNPKDNPMKYRSMNNKSKTGIKKEQGVKLENCQNADLSISGKENNGLSSASESMDKTNNNAYNPLPVPQLKISADGKIMIASESLIVQQQDSLAEERQLIEEDGCFSGLKRLKKSNRNNPDRQKWTFEETVNFYKALNTIGSDFEMMKTLFPDRSRKSLKSKFKKEERTNGMLIDKILGARHAKYDLEKLQEELQRGNEDKKPFTPEQPAKDYKDEIAKDKIVEIGNHAESNSREKPDHKSTKKKPNRRKPKCRKIFSCDAKEGGDDVIKKTSKTILPFSDKKVVKVHRKRKANKMSNKDLELQDEDSDSSDIQEFTRRKRKLKRKSYEMLSQLLRLDELNDCSTQEEGCINSKGENLVFNMNIDTGTIKYTQSVTYNPQDLENPIDVNETIAHLEDPLIICEDECEEK